ncbi:hypothetical protein [Anaerotruncus colihominis]|uniref:hypothetical protein n=1 Tax=Anaerotruncus colihominis TaxID=169435 RepID=UPI0026EED6D3|nr:hypothetical protein [Anaerotruncus colihominis]
MILSEYRVPNLGHKAPTGRCRDRVGQGCSPLPDSGTQGAQAAAAGYPSVRSA